MESSDGSVTTPVNWESLDALVAEFAASETLIEPASPLPSSSSPSSGSYGSRTINRQIRWSLENGEIDRAIELLRVHAPCLLEDHRILFRLEKQFCLEKPLSSSFGGVSLKTHRLQQDYDEEEEDDDDDLASLLSLFSAEEDHMPSAKYLKSLKDGEFVDSIRQDFISSISQSSSAFDPVLPYLAVNYADRFLSGQRLKRANPWVSRLLTMSCLSLAAKMHGAELPLSIIQGDGYDLRTVNRMEVLILGALGWRMRSVTPFSFVAFFTSLLKLKDEPSRQDLRARAAEIILKAQNDVELLRFKPSLIAASVLLSASYELFPIQFQRFKTAICGCSYINEEELIECYGAIQEVATERNESVVDDLSCSDTPQNVLDQQFSIGSSS